MLSDQVDSDVSSVTFSWSPIPGTVMHSYTISYYSTAEDCFTDSGDIHDVSSETLNYTLQDLQEHTQYTITIEALYEGFVIGTNVTMVTTKPIGTNF